MCTFCILMFMHINDFKTAICPVVRCSYCHWYLSSTLFLCVFKEKVKLNFAVMKLFNMKLTKKVFVEEHKLVWFHGEAAAVGYISNHGNWIVVGLYFHSQKTEQYIEELDVLKQCLCMGIIFLYLQQYICLLLFTHSRVISNLCGAQQLYDNILATTHNHPYIIRLSHQFF